MLDKFLKYSIFTISFFLYSGFYAVLALAISILGTDGSRFVSVPVRLITTALMILVIIVSFLYQKKEGKTKNKNLQIINLIFFLFWALYFLKILWHLNTGMPLRLGWFEYFLYAINFGVLPFYMFGLISFKKYKSTILNALILSGFLMGLTTLYLYKDILAAGVGRLHLYVYQNPALETLSPLALSYASVLTIMLCLYKLLYIKKKSKIIIAYLYITIGLSLVMFLLGASRGSVLALVLSVSYLIFHSDYKMKMKILLLVLASIPIFIYSVAASGSAVFERTTNSIDSGSTGREKLWADAGNEFIANPFLGGRIEIGYYPHNLFLEILMATGLLGFILIAILLVQGFIKIYILPKYNISFLWVGVIFLQGLCQSMFSGSLYTSTLVFFPFGILLSNYVKRKKQVN